MTALPQNEDIVLEQFFESHGVYAYYISRGCGPGSCSVLLNNVIKDVYESNQKVDVRNFLSIVTQRL